MEQLTREIIHTIEVEAHTSGLTNKIKNKLCLAIDGELPVEETDEEFVLEKPKLQNFKEELEQEEREKAEAEVQDDAGEDSEAEEVEAEENNDAEDKPNFYDVIKELKKKSQNKKDKNISYSDNSNNNSFILNNR